MEATPVQLGALEAEWGYPLFEFSVSGLPKYDLAARSRSSCLC